MKIINRSWKERYQKIEDIPTKKSLPFSEKIQIEQYRAKDLILNQEVCVKKININEDREIKDLAQYLWHYKISLNRKATNKSQGNTLLKLVDGQRDEEDGLFILVTESGGVSLHRLLEEEVDNEDKDSYNVFKSSNKKIKWEAILKLTKGLYSLHSSGLLHRNLSLDTIYFDGEAFRQGESEIFKIGDFNWSIYLHSISNITSDQLTSEIIKDNIHFFRAPESIPNFSQNQRYGETYKSDLYSFGLILSFLLIDLDVKKYYYSKLEQRDELYQEIIEEISEYRGFPEERDILMRLIELDPEKRFKNTDELLEAIRDFVEKIRHNFSTQSRLPVFYERDRTKIFVQRVSDDINMNIDALLKQPDLFLADELTSKKLYLTNSLQYPLWTKGKSGLYYRFKRLYKRSKLAQIEVFYLKQEKDLLLTNKEIVNVDTFYWADKDDKLPYMNWEGVFSNALSQIKKTEVILSVEAEKKRRWIDSINLIEETEEDFEKTNIFEYELMEEDESEKNQEKKVKNVTIMIYNEDDKDNFTELLNESQSNYIELLNSNNLFEKFRSKRKWKVVEIIDEDTQSTIVKLEGRKRNEDVRSNGYVRLWELKNTVFLLQRKRQIIKNLEYDDHILNAVLLPARYHKYFEKYNRSELVSFIYYTYPIFLLQGPPGTGKTWHAKELIKMVLEKDPYSRILVASKEHSALDDLLIKCVNMIGDLEISPDPCLIRLISPDRETLYSPTSIPYNYFINQVTKRFLNQLNQWNNQSYPELVEELKKTIRNELDTPSREWIDLIKECSNLVFCTSTASDLREFENLTRNFDLVVIEEAGKTYPSELFKPMQLGDKWVLIGDQNQLPPFRIEDINKILEEKLEQIEEEKSENPNFDSKDFLNFKNATKREVKVFQSMFERFKNIKHSFDDRDEIKSCDVLLNQYRLPSKISKMVSTIFYDKEFEQKVPDPKDFIIEPSQIKDEQLIWIKTPNSSKFKEKRKGVNLYNIGEARLISKLLFKIRINKKYKPFTFAILTPYKEQVDILKKILPNKLPHFNNIDPRNYCYTVDSFQGQEADLVIISLVRNNNFETPGRAWGFVPKLERLDVMISRAKKAEILIGNFDMCITHKGSPFMDKFVKVAKFIEKEGTILNHEEI